MAIGFGAAALGMLWLSRITPHTTYLAHVLPAEILISLGMGLAFVPMSSTALFRVPAHDAGVSSALVNTTQQVGGSLGTALLNTVAASATATYLLTRAPDRANVEAAQVHGYTVGFLVGAACLVVAFLSAVFLVNATKEDLADVDGVSGEVIPAESSPAGRRGDRGPPSAVPHLNVDRRAVGRLNGVWTVHPVGCPGRRWRVHRPVGDPAASAADVVGGNGAQPAGLVVLEGLGHLVPGVHHERPVGVDRLADGPATEHQHVEVRGTRVLRGPRRRR